MSSVVRPSGKLPPRVYWRRRLVVLAVVVLLGWFLLRAVTGDDQDPAASGASGPTADPSASAAPTSAPTTAPPVKAKARKAKNVVVDVALDDVAGACPVENVTLAPAVPAGSRTGSPARILLRLSLTGNADPCTVRLDGNALVLAVASADETVWESQRCGDIGSRTVDVRRGWDTVVALTWDGRASTDECGDDGFASAGAYTVKAALLGGEPAQQEFTLTDPPAPEPTPKPTPKPTKKSSSAPTPTAKPSPAPAKKTSGDDPQT